MASEELQAVLEFLSEADLGSPTIAERRAAGESVAAAVAAGR